MEGTTPPHYNYWTNGYLPPGNPLGGLPGNTMVHLDALKYPTANFPGNYPPAISGIPIPTYGTPSFPGKDEMGMANFPMGKDSKEAMETMMMMSWQNMVGKQAMMMYLGAMYNQALTEVIGSSTNKDPPPGYIWVGPNEMLYVGTDKTESKMDKMDKMEISENSENTAKTEGTERTESGVHGTRWASPRSFFDSQSSSDCSSSEMDWVNGCNGGSWGNNGGEAISVTREESASMDSGFDGYGVRGGSNFGKMDETTMKETVTSAMQNWMARGMSRGTPLELKGQLRDWLMDFGGFQTDSIDHLMSATDDELGIP